jgi:sigma-E factor negative regulatory protein RseA
MTNKKLESLSALLDDEVTQQELTDSLTRLNKNDTDSFARYSMIGDVLRKEHHIETNFDFADGIQAALANVEQDKPVANSNLVELASHPKWHQRVVGKLQQFTQTSSAKNISQLAIAASVAFVAVIGVSNMQPTDEHMPSPVLQTMPLVNGISPVSTDGLAEKPTANQVTQSRINSLIADHNQQLRTHSDEEQEQQENKQ